MMMQASAGLGTAILDLRIVQYCYVVPNLEEACKHFHEVFGIGPFLGGGEAVLDRHVYRGASAEPIVLKGVFGQSGDLNIELVELVSTEPSAFRDMYPGTLGGIHHVAAFSPDYEATKKRFKVLGLAVASEFEMSFGTRICYVDARHIFGHMIELYPEDPIVRGMYRQTADARRTWDGHDLVIPWA